MANKVNYYKIIDGLNFDSELLIMADELVKGQGDGRTVTKVEARTILYILKNYKLTNEATQNFLDKLIKFD